MKHTRGRSTPVIASAKSSTSGLPASIEKPPPPSARICGVRFIFTTGGTGMTPDDVTPEATAAVIERPAPGFAEALRAEALRHTPMGILTRGTSGIAGRTLIVNLPGSPKAVGELFGVLAPTLRHVADTLGRDGGRRGGH